MSQPRRHFLRTLAAGLGASAFPGHAQDAAPGESEPEPTVVLRPPERPSGIPTLWLGAVTHESAVVKTKLPPGVSAKLYVLKPGEAPLVFPPQKSGDLRSTITTFHLSKLDAATLYTFSLEVNGKPSSYPPGLLRTFPTPGKAADFRFAFGSCARTGSQHSVFSLIASREPSVFVHLGDLHYTNISRDDPRLFRAAWDTVLSSTSQGALYRTVPLAYVWDDHDFGPNGSDIRSPSRAAARKVYREYAPHYPLPADSALPQAQGNLPIYQAFTLGRARFILTDLRSERAATRQADGPAKSMLGPLQKDWFLKELLSASRSHAIVFWGSSLPWIGTAAGDSWAAYDTERREIANFIAQNGIRNLCILGGDAHMVAADDGSHSDYSDKGGLRIPVLHGSALDQGGSVKGGPYSHGAKAAEPGEGCFGWVEVKDDGKRVAVAFSGRNQDDQVRVSLDFEW